MRTQVMTMVATLSLGAASLCGALCGAVTCGAQEARPAEKGLVGARAAQDLPDDRKAKEVPIGMWPPVGLAGQPGNGLPFQLTDLVLAKISDSGKGPQLVAMVEQTRTERRTVTVTKLIQEVRTRKVSVPDKEGRLSEVDQEYTVTVPVAEEVEQTVQVPAGQKPATFLLNELRIYRLDGTRLTEAHARKALEKLTPVFLLRGFTGEVKAVEEVYLQALNPNCLIVVTEKAE